MACRPERPPARRLQCPAVVPRRQGISPVRSFRRRQGHHSTCMACISISLPPGSRLAQAEGLRSPKSHPRRGRFCRFRLSGRPYLELWRILPTADQLSHSANSPRRYTLRSGCLANCRSQGHNNAHFRKCHLVLPVADREAILRHRNSETGMVLPTARINRSHLRTQRGIMPT